MARTARELLDDPGVDVLRRRGRDCWFYYRLDEDGQPVERAVHDDGRIGSVYDATGLLEPIDDKVVTVVDAGSWPRPERAAVDPA